MGGFGDVRSKLEGGHDVTAKRMVECAIQVQRASPAEVFNPWERTGDHHGQGSRDAGGYTLTTSDGLKSLEMPTTVKMRLEIVCMDVLIGAV